jgi:hypothetical protein
MKVINHLSKAPSLFYTYQFCIDWDVLGLNIRWLTAPILVYHMCATREPTTPLVWPPTVLLLSS